MDNAIVDNTSDISAIAHEFNEYINNAQSVIDEQMSKIATLTSQVENLASDNKRLRNSNKQMSVKLASVKHANEDNNLNDSPVLKRISSIISSLNHSGFIKNASANANINDFISNPNKLLGLLEDISGTFVDLGLLNEEDNNSKFANDEAADYLVNSTNNQNKNDAGFLTSQKGGTHAASSFENHYRNKIAEENKAREESFLNSLNKSNY